MNNISHLVLDYAAVHFRDNHIGVDFYDTSQPFIFHNHTDTVWLNNLSLSAFCILSQRSRILNFSI